MYSGGFLGGGKFGQIFIVVLNDEIKKNIILYTPKAKKRRLENLKKNNDVFVLNSVPNTVLNFNVDLLYLLLLENILKIQYAYFKKAFPVTFDIGLHKRALF